MAGRPAEDCEHWIHRLENGSPAEKVAAAGRLVECSGPATVSALKSSLWSDAPEVRRAVARSLARLDAYDTLVHILQEREPYKAYIRRAVVSAIGLCGPRAAGPIVGAMGDPEPDVREEAMEAAIALGEAAVGPLIAALGSPDVNVRWRAATALGRLRDRRALPALIQAVDAGRRRPSARERVHQLVRAADEAVVDLLSNSREDEPAPQALTEPVPAADRMVRSVYEEAIRLITEAAGPEPAELLASRAPEGHGSELEAADGPAGTNAGPLP